jgi:hypothetical protein
LLFALEGQRGQIMHEAQQALSQGQGPRLLTLAQQAHALCADEESGRLMAAGYLLCGDFAAAWQVYSEHFGKPAIPSPQPG